MIIIIYSEEGHTYEPLQYCDQLCSRTSATAVEQWRDQTGAGAAAAFPQPGRVAAPAQGRDQRPSVTITLINGYIIIHFCLRYLTLGNQVSFPFKTHEGEGGNGWHPWSFMSLALKTG